MGEVVGQMKIRKRQNLWDVRTTAVHRNYASIAVKDWDDAVRLANQCAVSENPLAVMLGYRYMMHRGGI